MAHVRQQLREAVKNALEGLATTGPRVFDSRLYPLQDTELPALRIYTETEEAEVVTIHGADMERTVELRVEGVAKADADLDDKLDTIAAEVEAVLASGVTLVSKRVDPVYTGCDIELSGEGEKPTGSIILRYTARLYTAAGAPEVLS